MKNKAINFLEYVQNLKNKYKEADWDSYENCNTAKDIIFKATEFYSQPFHVDLIEKCFEGITKCVVNQDIVAMQKTEGHWERFMKVGKIKNLDNFIYLANAHPFNEILSFSPYSLSQLNLDK